METQVTTLRQPNYNSSSSELLTERVLSHCSASAAVIVVGGCTTLVFTIVGEGSWYLFREGRPWVAFLVPNRGRGLGSGGAKPKEVGKIPLNTAR